MHVEVQSATALLHTKCSHAPCANDAREAMPATDSRFVDVARALGAGEDLAARRKTMSSTPKLATRLFLAALVLVPAFGAMGCASHDDDAPGAAEAPPASRAEGIKFAKGLMGVRSDAPPSTDAQGGRYEAVVELIVQEVERRYPAVLDAFPAEMASGDPVRVERALHGMQDALAEIGSSAALRARVLVDPRFAGIGIRNTGTKEPTTDNTGDDKKDEPAAKADLGKGPDGKFGDGRQGALGAAQDTATLAGVGAQGGIGAAMRLNDLNKIDNGTLKPDPESRLGAYDATKGYPNGTVGNSVHNAIGTIYTGMGTYGQENIGRVFNSDEARALYPEPVDSDAGRKMAEIEHGYWENVKKEDPYSAGGQLGSAFSPAARDFLQRNVFTK
jgi:hypothetical protein